VVDVKKADGRIAAIGTVTGTVAFGPATARVPADRRRDIERNHTATHLLHAALRQQLGEHVHQAGSLVAPERLRFDFTHHGPLTQEQLASIERQVNEGIWHAAAVDITERKYADAVAAGAMALFGEKYGDVVRVVNIPGLSTELCGGTHVRNTAEIGLFRVVSEGGVAAGVRRIEAVTGRRAFALLSERDASLASIGQRLKVQLGGGTALLETLEKKVEALIEERRSLEKKLDEVIKSGGAASDATAALLAARKDVHGVSLIAARVPATDVKLLQALGDTMRESMGSGIAVLAADFGDGKGALLTVITDDLRERGLRADAIVRDIAVIVGGRGGGKPHMAQAGLPDSSRIDEALAAADGVVAAAAGA
jgi:alanyl-tRNA synthetase